MGGGGAEKAPAAEAHPGLREAWINVYASPETGRPILGLGHAKRRKARDVMRAMVKHDAAVPLYRIHVRLK